jgi:mRNA-degrading endonuclease RelE of RelBE toxin-antitoxin system
MVNMVSRPRFSIIYAPQVKRHLRAVEPKYYSLIRKEIETQLQFEPGVETRNRKPLKPPSALEGEWELRFGPGNRFRAFYEIDREKREVHILAIGVKHGSLLIIGGEEVEL